MNTSCTAGAMAPDAAPADPRAVLSEYLRTRTVTPALLPSLGPPGSTTHLSSSGVAGTMAAHRSVLQRGTIRSLLVAWVLTLPSAIPMSGSLYWLFVNLS